MPKPSRLPSSIGAEADQLEDAMRRARFSLDHEVAVWETYGDHGLAPAQHVLTAIKEAKSPVLMRQKASQPGMVTVQLPRDLADALSQARADEGDGRITALLRQVAGQQIAVSAGGTLTDSGDQSKPVTKAAAPDLKDLISSAFDHVAREGIH
jgi:hypothetical protein